MKKILLALVTFIIILSGCGAKNNESSGETITNSDGTITNTDDLGNEVTYSTDRIYADSYVGELMYLDANLVGADMTYQSSTWPEDKVSSTVNTGGDMEVVADLNPTLIITYNEDYVDQFSTIAPTFYIEYGKDNAINTVIRLAHLLGLEDKAADIDEQFNKRIDDIKVTIDQPDLTYTIVEPDSESIYLMGYNWARGGFILYDYLDMKGTEAGEQDYIRVNPSYMTVNDEQLLNYVGDVAIVVADSEDNKFTNSEVYDQLDAVKNGNVYYMDTAFGWYDDPYAVEKQLDFFEELFSGEL